MSENDNEDKSIEGTLIEYADNGELLFVKDTYSEREYLQMSRYVINSENNWDSIRSGLIKLIEHSETQLEEKAA